MMNGSWQSLMTTIRRRNPVSSSMPQSTEAQNEEASGSERSLQPYINEYTVFQTGIGVNSDTRSSEESR